MVMRSLRQRHWLLALPGLVLLLLACAQAPWAATTTNDTPSWACPSPTPLPYAEQGPVKEWLRGEPKPTAVPSGPLRYDDDVPVYYLVWEQEAARDGTSNAPPFPSPTPYVRNGVSFSLGQRVRVSPLFVQLAARPGPLLGRGQQLYLVELRWLNPTTQAYPFRYTSQLRLAAVLGPDGRERQGERWLTSYAAQELAALPPLPDMIPVGESTVTVAIAADAGIPQRVELTVRRGLTAPAPSTTPTTGPQPTPTANTELRAEGPNDVTVAFVADKPAGPLCASPGATTAWDTRDPGAQGVADVPVNAPPGAGRIVELALAQVGRPYVWGAAGPTSFDCSGLVIWLYGQIGLSIPSGPSNGGRAESQYNGMRPVEPSQAQAGDAIYFNPRGSTSITHAAIYVGNVAGGPIGDFVHAVSPKYGTVLQVDGVQDVRYRANCNLNCLAGFRTLR